jgi:hypothetical protein
MIEKISLPKKIFHSASSVDTKVRVPSLKHPIFNYLLPACSNMIAGPGLTGNNPEENSSRVLIADSSQAYPTVLILQTPVQLLTSGIVNWLVTLFAGSHLQGQPRLSANGIMQIKNT